VDHAWLSPATPESDRFSFHRKIAIHHRSWASRSSRSLIAVETVGLLFSHGRHNILSQFVFD
jgi:hypothetical protein